MIYYLKEVITRHWKKKLTIIWYLLTDQYTNSDEQKCWWLWIPNETVLITFDKETYDNRDIKP